MTTNNFLEDIFLNDARVLAAPTLWLSLQCTVQTQQSDNNPTLEFSLWNLFL